MKAKVKYTQNPHQKEFHEDVSSKFLHLSTGFGGGKTHSLIMKVLQLSALNPHIPGGLVAPSIADFKKDVLPLFLEILDVNKIAHRYHQTDKWFAFPWTKGRLYIATAEKPIRGPNWGYAGINEVSLISHTRYKEVIGRVRIKKAAHPQIASSGTPEGTGHWLYDVFVENPMRNSRIIYGDTRDNQVNLADDYIQSLEDSYDKVMLDAYLRGLFVNMTGNRFYYSYDPSKTDDKSIEYNEMYEIHCSMDFNVNPMTATLWQIFPCKDARGNFIYGVDGFPIKEAHAYMCIELENADTNKMCEALKSRGATPDKTIIYPDPSAKARKTSGFSDVAILRNHGYQEIRMRNTQPEFRRRQLGHNNLLDKGLIKINPLTCKGLKRDYESVEQDPATYQKIKKNPKLTHFSDGADYMMDILFPLSGNKPQDSPGSVKIR